MVTGDALGIEAGATKTNISHWENGVHMPDLAQLAALCDALECSADRLLGRAEQLAVRRAIRQLQRTRRQLPSG
jgi:transcriptional regulator with XRE-family HTH domain